MLFNALSSLAFVALAGHAIAGPAPQNHHMNVARMSVRDIFGLQIRDDAEYQPTQTLCGSGTTCAEACGKGFDQCSSKDDQIHCFNPTVGEKCCKGAADGNACEAGFYCANDGKGATWCCKDGDEACGGKIPASLLSSTSVAAKTTALPTTSTTAPAKTSSKTSSSSSASSSATSKSSASVAAVHASTTSAAAALTSHSANCTTYTTAVIVPVTTKSGTNSTHLITSAGKTPARPSPSANATTSAVPVTASSNDQRPVIAFVLGAAVLAALAL